MSESAEEHHSSEEKGKTPDHAPTEIQYIEKKEHGHKNYDQEQPQKQSEQPQKQPEEPQKQSEQPQNHSEEPQKQSDQREADSIENYDLSEPKTLIQRLGDYAIVNKAFTTYDYIKNSSPLLNAGLSSAETATAIALAYTAPVILPRVQPILQAVDAKFGVEEKANQLLDIVEAKVANANDTIQNTTAYVSSSKIAAQETLRALPQKSYEVLVDHPIELLLERLEQLVERFLPQSFDVEKVDASNLKDQTKLQRATHLGLEVPKRIVNLAQHKYQVLQLSEDQLPGFAFLIDLIQYAVDQIDLNAKKAQASEVFATTKARILEGKEKVTELVQDGKAKVGERYGDINEQYVSPLKSIIEKRLEEISQSDLKTYAGVMAAIAHASELAKRQLYMKYEDSKNLIPEFEAYLDSSKKAIQSFDKNELPTYLSTMRTNAVDALTSVLALISQYVPEDLKQKLPTLNDIGNNLETWRETIEQRLLSVKEANAKALNDSPSEEIKKKDNGESVGSK
jgi:hypothetical protein